MDIVLSITDTFLFDRFYATVLPVLSASDNATTTTTTTTTTTPPPPSMHAHARPIQLDAVSQYFGWQPSEHAYLSRLQRDDDVRQIFSLFLITWLFGCIIYFFFATLSYVFIFDKDTFKHPKFLKNQIRQEIYQSVVSMPVMAVLTAPLFYCEVKGYSLLYLDVDKYGWWYMLLQFPLFLAFTDGCIYWIHRGLHHPAIYRHMHKSHHKWIVPTPYASHAFHPLDGYAQGIPYHVFPFILPLHKYAYLVLFTLVNIWTVMIHDGEYMSNSPVLNGAACHTMHHLYFNYNYGQFTTIWDRLGGSYRKPNIELFYRQTKMAPQEWDKQIREMEKVVQEMEGNGDSREHPSEDSKKSQ